MRLLVLCGSHLDCCELCKIGHTVATTPGSPANGHVAFLRALHAATQEQLASLAYVVPCHSAGHYWFILPPSSCIVSGSQYGAAQAGGEFAARPRCCRAHADRDLHPQRRHRWGMRRRAQGEHPAAAKQMNSNFTLACFKCVSASSCGTYVPSLALAVSTSPRAAAGWAPTSPPIRRPAVCRVCRPCPRRDGGKFSPPRPRACLPFPPRRQDDVCGIAGSHAG